MNMPLEPQEQMTVGQRIVGILFNPRLAFADIEKQTKWVPPLLIIMAVSFLCSLASVSKLKEYTRYTLELQAQNIPELANEATMAMAVNSAAVFALIGSMLSPVVVCLLCAGLLKLFNLFAGEPARFRQFFAVTVYSYFPLLIGSVIAAIMIVMSPATHLEEVSTSLYLLFPPGSKGFAASLARQVDPFYLWSLGLMALGSSVISRVQFRTYAAYVFAIWLIFALGTALLAQGV
ncbi:MAG TPA: YIP1 family protein [Syntrophomonadaceae bacterium]|nr:hypothetical protein [Syntrophomonadaceae bacterium]HOQ10309.1 YIP1 family protein [Syntrophomonadaceae bacterium]HPU49541.1 YIP1 family protein [Syntrophomonadaceae bacterium]